MTTPELVAALARTCGTSEAEAGELVRRVFEAVAETVLAGVPVSVDGFGTFERYTRRERRGRNPRTGARLTIPAKGAVRFTPAPSLRRRAAGHEPQ